MGVLTTAGTAIRSGDRLSELYEMYIAEKNYSDRPTKDINKEYAAKVIKEVTPVVLSTGFTVGTIIMLCKHSIKTEAGLIAGLYFAERQLERVKELGADEQVNQAMLEDIDVDWLDINKGKVIVYEPYSDQLIVTTEAAITKADEHLNKRLQNNYIVRLRTLLKDLKAYIPDIADNIGWEMGNEEQMYYWKLAQAPYINLKLSKPYDIHGREIYVLEYEIPPTWLKS